MHTILIVDDESEIRSSLQGVLEDEGYKPLLAESAEECLATLDRKPVDVVMLDIWLPGMDGLEARERIVDVDDPPEVIMISGHGNIETAVRATKLGAFDFLEKPLSIERTLIVLTNAIDAKRLRSENLEYKKQFHARSVLVGESIPMKALRQQISLMAPTNGRVLIYGESGSGKELVARAIHAQSLRKDAMFVEVNCAAIPEDLIESELFGHRAGSFPGATSDKEGKFQKADGGTLFLDEVGDMSLKTQAKVLRALDEHRFEPVGASEWIQVDARVVASTNKNLEEEIERGNFREDLFYRLNVVPFHVPPLRELIEDVRLLAQHFLNEFTTAYGRKPKELSEEAFRALEDYSWPGNVRELRNLMERIVIMNPQPRLDLRHIPLDRGRRGAERAVEPLGSLQEVREAAERDYILRKLEEAKGNVTRA